MAMPQIIVHPSSSQLKINLINGFEADVHKMYVPLVTALIPHESYRYTITHYSSHQSTDSLLPEYACIYLGRAKRLCVE